MEPSQTGWRMTTSNLHKVKEGRQGQRELSRGIENSIGHCGQWEKGEKVPIIPERRAWIE